MNVFELDGYIYNIMLLTLPMRILQLVLVDWDRPILSCLLQCKVHNHNHNL